MRDIAPDITRQRLLVEGFYDVDLDDARVEEYLQGVAANLGLRTYGRPAIFAPAGEGQAQNQGFDAFLPLIDSGISLYVWTGPRFLAVVLFTCTAFDEVEAVAYTRRFFALGAHEAQGF